MREEGDPLPCGSHLDAFMPDYNDGQPVILIAYR